MKILVVCQYYYPEPFRISDICEELVKRGHEVSVVCGVPNYPKGDIYEGFRHGERRDELINGVSVHRCHTVPRKNNFFCRALNYAGYALFSTLYINKLDGSYDVVIVNQLSPVIMAYAGIRYKKKHGKKLLLYCLDLWPGSLITGGIKKDSLIYRFFTRVSDGIYKQADCLMVSSLAFYKYFDSEFGIKKAEYLPQYAEALFTPEQCRKEPDGKIDLMFAGNVGVLQSVETIVEAARLTEDEPRLRWHIVGEGKMLNAIKKQAEGLSNISFYGRQPLEEMPKYYAMADAMLVTMRREPILELTLPGKMQSYMAAGKPVIGSIGGEARMIIGQTGCGLCADSEDAAGLAAAARQFITVSEKNEMGERSYEFYKNNFAKEKVMGLLEKRLSELM